VKRALILAFLLLCAAGHVRAQCLPPMLPPEEQAPCTLRYPGWTGELATLGANALLGGVSGGVTQKLRGGSFSDGFLRGLAGGAVIYGGKRIASERFGGAGLVGRQVVAVGASMVRNAGAGDATFESVVLPVGVGRLYLSRGGGMRFRADLMTLGWLAYALQEDEVVLDGGMSLSAGSFVFRTRGTTVGLEGDSVHASGIAETGILFIADVPAFGRDYARRTFEHERIHVLQMDQIFLTMTNPVEDAVLTRVPYLRRVEPYVDVNLSSMRLHAPSARIPDHRDRPWETEAIFFSR